MSGSLLGELLLTGRSDEALEIALQEPTERVRAQLRSLPDTAAAPLEEFRSRWLRSLPPLERLQAAREVVPDSELLVCCSAAAQTIADELRDFAAFTDGPDAEVHPVILERLESDARELEAMSVGLAAPGLAGAHGQRGDFEWLSAAGHRQAMLERHWAGRPDRNELVELVAAGDQEGAVRLALQHRSDWVDHRLDYESVDDNAEAFSDFLQRWLPALPPLERLQATGTASAHYLGALVWLAHAHGTGVRLSLDAYAAAVAAFAAILRALAGASDVQPLTAQRLYRYAEQLDAMSFEFVPR